MFNLFQFWKTCSSINLQALLRESAGRRNVFSHRSSPGTSSSKKRKQTKSKTSIRKKTKELPAVSSQPVEQGRSHCSRTKSQYKRLISQSASSKTTILPGRDVQVHRSFEVISGSTASSCKMATGRSESSPGIVFTFMSYNILAQDLLELHSYLYRYCNPEHLDWRHRLDRIANEILPLRPDILCLQEVQKDHISDILKALKQLNYDYIFKKKTGSKSDGCAILFNKEVFELVETHTVEYYQPKVNYLDRENVALIAKLCIKGMPTSCFIASTTHLLYNPRRQDVRLAQIKLLLAELDHVSFRKFDSDGQIKRYPIILSGDFNLKPHSAPYRLITAGNLVYHNLTQRTLEPSNDNQSLLNGANFLPRHLGITDNCQHYDLVKNKYQGQSRIQNTDRQKVLNESPSADSDSLYSESQKQLFSTGKLQHFLNLKSVYDHMNKNDATTFQERWVTVDYIFYSEPFSSGASSDCDGYLKLVSRYSLPSAKQCYDMRLFIPNAYLGSDHLSLAAKFYFVGPSSDENKSEKNTSVKK